jgi:hypothetical protein
MPTEENQKNFQNSETVISIENNARNNIKYTLDGVFDFMNFRHKDMAPQYKVFKELFVICWNTEKKYETRHFISFDIELMKKRTRLSNFIVLIVLRSVGV